MPGGDQTGPRGGGPKTGRSLGDCADNDQSGYAAYRAGKRSGRGFRWGGRGRFRRNRLNAGTWPGRSRDRLFARSVSQDQDADSLKAQAEELQNALQETQTRLAELEAEE